MLPNYNNIFNYWDERNEHFSRLVTDNFQRNQGKSDFKNDQDERSIIELCNTLITTTSETSALVANKVLTKYSSLAMQISYLSSIRIYSDDDRP